MAVINDIDIRRSPLVTLTGEVDQTGSGRVTDVLEELLQSGCERARVDLAGVSSMDTDGLLAVLKSCEQFQRKEGSFEVVSINPLVKQLFETTGRMDVIHSSEEHAPPPPLTRQPVTDCLAIAGDMEVRSFSVKATLESCKVVRDRVAQSIAAIPFTDDERADVKLAVGEAITNAIRHGCEEQAGEMVTVRLFATGQKLVIEIFDTGKGFDPAQTAIRDDEWTLTEGNMGLRFMQQFMDEVSFDFSPGGTTIKLVKHVTQH